MAVNTTVPLVYPIGGNQRSLELAVRGIIDVLRTMRTDIDQQAAIDAIEQNLTQIESNIGTIENDIDFLESAAVTDQERFLWGLYTAFEAVQGSAAETLAYAETQLRKAADAVAQIDRRNQDNAAQIIVEQQVRVSETETFAQQLTSLSAYLAGAGATIIDIETAVSNGDSSVAEKFSLVESSVAGNTSSIGSISTSIDGIHAQWGISTNMNGRVTGLVTLDSIQNTSKFTVVSDKFEIVNYTDNGNLIVPFVVGNIGGVGSIGMTGNVLLDGTLVARHIAAGAIETAALAAGSVNASKIASGSVETSKLAAGAVTAETIASGAVTADKIAAGSITAGKIAAGEITVDKIAVNGLTGNVLTETVETLDVYPTTTSTTFVDIPDTEIEVTVADNEKLLLIFNAVFSGGSDLQATPIYRIMMDGAVAPNTPVYFAGSGNTLSITQTTPVIIAPTASFSVILSPSAGTHTFKAQWRRPGWDSAARITFRSLQIMRFLR